MNQLLGFMRRLRGSMRCKEGEWEINYWPQEYTWLVTFPITCKFVWLLKKGHMNYYFSTEVNIQLSSQHTEKCTTKPLSTILIDKEKVHIHVLMALSCVVCVRSRNHHTHYHFVFSLNLKSSDLLCLLTKPTLDGFLPNCRTWDQREILNKMEVSVRKTSNKTFCPDNTYRQSFLHS